MSTATPDLPSLAFTGERMVPHLADELTEMYHWQRYLFFRPWYEGRRVVDAACGEGYGTGYIGTFASEAIGIDVSDEAVAHARERYPHARFAVADVAGYNYSEAEVVVSFETIEHLADPSAFLRALKSCTGTIVISTPHREFHSPGNALGDKPWNPFHTIEWTPSEFAELIGAEFPDRRVRWLSQLNDFPGRIVEGLLQDARYTIAVIGDLALPKWPSIGLAMPTVNGGERAFRAVKSLALNYPGRIDFAVVANGSDERTRQILHEMAQVGSHFVSVIESETNIGYGRGANLGLDHLWQDGWYDYFGVVNDDVLPAIDCVSSMVATFDELLAQGQKPGIVGCYSNAVAGAQCVNIGLYGSYAEMLGRAEVWHRANHSGATQALQVRGLFFLMGADCLSDVGGFDPRFGIGNFEDDDLNARVRCAGYTLWLADGAYLHHDGSTTFKEMKVDYDHTIARNQQLIYEKWGAESLAQILTADTAPEWVPLYVPLTAKPPRSEFVARIQYQDVDLVHEASEIEFAAYLVHHLRTRPRTDRAPILEALRDLAA